MPLHHEHTTPPVGPVITHTLELSDDEAYRVWKVGYCAEGTGRYGPTVGGEYICEWFGPETYSRFLERYSINGEYES